MSGLTKNFYNEIFKLGADLASSGDITELPPEVRAALPVGVCVAVYLPVDIIRGITELPTQAYMDFYNRANELLDLIVSRGAEYLKSAGYTAIAQTREYVGKNSSGNNTLLPHKTVATRAGVGWIGKCALLVTKSRGSMLRISSILTDAPLETAKPVNESSCGDCIACAQACPGQAVSGRLWEKGKKREMFFDADKCEQAARERSKQGFGGDATICGKCIAVCPYSRSVIEQSLHNKKNTHS